MLREPKWGTRGLQVAKYLSATCTARLIILITPPLITVTQIYSSAEKLMFSRGHHVQGYMKHNNVIFLQKKEVWEKPFTLTFSSNPGRFRHSWDLLLAFQIPFLRSINIGCVINSFYLHIHLVHSSVLQDGWKSRRKNYAGNLQRTQKTKQENNHKTEAYRMRKELHQLYIWQRADIKNIQRTQN